MQLDKAVSLFLGEHKPTTRKAYAHALLPMRDWVGPARELATIKPVLLIEYWQTVVQPHGYALATERKLAKGIKTFFNWCVKIDLLRRSPAAMLKAQRIPRLISRDKAMRDDELAAVLDHLRHKTIPRDYALVLFIAQTGCRIGGAAGLKLADIDWAVLRALVTEKGHDPRPVAFDDDCARALRHWLAYRSAHYAIRGVHVFSRYGEPPNPKYLGKQVRRACLAVGIRSLGPHSLRHRKGHQLSDHKVSPPVAATAMGITTGVMLGFYYPTDWETAERELRKLMAVDAAPPDNIVRLESYGD